MKAEVTSTNEAAKPKLAALGHVQGSENSGEIPASGCLRPRMPPRMAMAFWPTCTTVK